MLPPVVLPTASVSVTSATPDPSTCKLSAAEDSQDDEDSHFVTNDVMNSSVIEQVELEVATTNSKQQDSARSSSPVDADCECGSDIAAVETSDTANSDSQAITPDSAAEHTTMQNSDADIDSTMICDDVVDSGLHGVDGAVACRRS